MRGIQLWWHWLIILLFALTILGCILSCLITFSITPKTEVIEHRLKNDAEVIGYFMGKSMSLFVLVAAPMIVFVTVAATIALGLHRMP